MKNNKTNKNLTIRKVMTINHKNLFMIDLFKNKIKFNTFLKETENTI